MTKYMLAVVCFALLLAMSVPASVDAQIAYARGTGCQPDIRRLGAESDGSYTMHFGYFNRNTEEDFNIPIGPDNNIRRRRPRPADTLLSGPKMVGVQCRCSRKIGQKTAAWCGR